MALEQNCPKNMKFLEILTRGGGGGGGGGQHLQAQALENLVFFWQN